MFLLQKELDLFFFNGKSVDAQSKMMLFKYQISFLYNDNHGVACIVEQFYYLQL